MAAPPTDPSGTGPTPIKKLGLAASQPVPAPVPDPTDPVDPPEHTDPFTSGHSEDD